LFVVLASVPRVAAAECVNDFPNQFPESSPLPKTDRAYIFLEELKTKAGIQKTPIQICAWDDKPTDFNMICGQSHGMTIYVSQWALANFIDMALLGAIAHELGHITRKNCYSVKNKYIKEFEEEQADVYAIKLDGADQLLMAYLQNKGDMALAKRRVARALKLAKAQNIK
jgi:hypothetical protein